MKLLKWLLGLLLLLGLVFAIGGFFLPASSHVERSIRIQRSPADVHAMLDSYQRFNEWSPWYAMEPSAKYEIGGPPSGVGATMRWVGDRVGEGSQRITASVPGREVTTALDFGGTLATAKFVLTPDGDGTRVVWSFDSEHGNDWMGRWFGLLFDRLIGRDYETGLAKLKAVMESERL